MNEPYKIVRTMQYTEVVYHTADGTPVVWERREDDFTYDESAAEPMTEAEIDDYPEVT